MGIYYICERDIDYIYEAGETRFIDQIHDITRTKTFVDDVTS